MGIVEFFISIFIFYFFLQAEHPLKCCNIVANIWVKLINYKTDYILKMIKDNNEINKINVLKSVDSDCYSVGNITGTVRQITATIKASDWKHFPINQRVMIIAKNGLHIIRKIRSISKGKQRVLTIPKDDMDIFKKGDKVKLFPINKPIMDIQEDGQAEIINETTSADTGY